MTGSRGTLVAALVVSMLAVARPVSAQGAETTPLSIAGGYSAVREQGAGGAPAVNYNAGWLAALTVPFAGRVSFVGEAGANYRGVQGVETQTLYGFLGGVRFDLLHLGPARVFAQGLVGLERFSEPGFSEAGLAIQPGAGVDIGLTRRLALRGQADFRVAREESVTFHEIRGAVSIVWR